MKKLFVHGTPDLEWSRAMSLAEEAGYICVTGYVSRRDYYRGGGSYRLLSLPFEILNQDWDEVVRFECDGPALEMLTYHRLVVIDHHRPGDPGYEAPPEHFWEGSSLGQFCRHLGASPTERDLLIAAGDHCLGAAYAGRCPGVDPQRLRAFRLYQRCSFNRLRDYEAEYYWRLCERLLEEAPRLSWAGEEIADLRQVDIPWNANLLSDAAGWKRLAVLFHKTNYGIRRLRLSCALPATVAYFLEELVPELGLEDPYGVPQRGFAGAYYPLSRSGDDSQELLLLTGRRAPSHPPLRHLRGRWRIDGVDYCAAVDCMPKVIL
jgi:hypothetical protein